MTYNTYGFNANYISSLADSPTLQEIWDAAGNGSSVDYFPGSSGQQYTYDVTSSLNSIVQSAVNSSSKRIKLGFVSATEVSNVPSTTLFYLGLKIYYDRPVSFTVRNNFNAGVLNVNGNSNFSSGGTVNTWETFTNTFQAIEPQSNAGVNYLWNDTEGAANKSKWERNKGISTTDKGATQSISPVAVYDDNGAEFVANMRPYYGITFQNNFVGVGNGGTVIVGSTQYDSPTSSFQVVDLNSITATAQNQSLNGIQYTFSQWSNASTSATTTFNPNSTMTYTASFVGKPDNTGKNVNFGTTVNAPIVVKWTDNINTNVTSYSVYRRVYKNNVWGPETLMGTFGRGVKQFQDPDYLLANYKQYDLINYDVREYYSVEGTYSDPQWVPVWGQLFTIHQSNNNTMVVNAEKPIEYSIANFPNPFNPTTTINYQLPENGFVTIKVFDILGKEVATLVNENKAAGYYNINFDASRLTSGVYIYTINTNGFSQSKKMLLMK